MNEPTRGELGKARRALRKLGEFNFSQERLVALVVYLRAKGLDLMAHSSKYVANFLRRSGNSFHPPIAEEGEGFEAKKGNKYVRPDDPETSQEAAKGLDIKGDEIIAFAFFERYYTEHGITAGEFEEKVMVDLIEQGWDRQKAQRRAASLRRRLTGLEEKAKIEVRYNPDGKLWKRDRRQIYFLVEVCESSNVA